MAGRGFADQPLRRKTDEERSRFEYTKCIFLAKLIKSLQMFFSE